MDSGKLEKTFNETSVALNAAADKILLALRESVLEQICSFEARIEKIEKDLPLPQKEKTFPKRGWQPFLRMFYIIYGLEVYVGYLCDIKDKFNYANASSIKRNALEAANLGCMDVWVENRARSHVKNGITVGSSVVYGRIQLTEKGEKIAKSLL